MERVPSLQTLKTFKVWTSSHFQSFAYLSCSVWLKREQQIKVWKFEGWRFEVLNILKVCKAKVSNVCKSVDRVRTDKLSNVQTIHTFKRLKLSNFKLPNTWRAALASPLRDWPHIRTMWKQMWMCLLWRQAYRQTRTLEQRYLALSFFPSHRLANKPNAWPVEWLATVSFPVVPEIAPKFTLSATSVCVCKYFVSNLFWFWQTSDVYLQSFNWIWKYLVHWSRL